jgi:nucleoside-diphosphate-sugar epimerase
MVGTTMNAIENILVTGGAGYVGAVLVPKLLERGYRVKVLDLFIFGEDVLPHHNNLIKIKGDIRNQNLLHDVIAGCDAVIHLACISNDPSYELNPELSKSINYDAFIPLVDISKQKKIRRFIYASSSSVYGIKREKEVTEDLSLMPLTDYSKYKALCEEYVQKSADNNFVVTTIRPSTVCGYSPRLRLDLTVNIFTNQAINNKKLTVFGGNQMRPNLHISDMTDLYLFLLEQNEEKINRKTYNVGYENYSVAHLAKMVCDVIDPALPIIKTPTNDTRSYHISSRKIEKELGFKAHHTIQEAIGDLKSAFNNGLIENSMENIRYYNIKTMQHLQMV